MKEDDGDCALGLLALGTAAPAWQTCHGNDDGGVAPMFAKLASQFPAYLEERLAAFKSGARFLGTLPPVLGTARGAPSLIAAGAQWISLGCADARPTGPSDLARMPLSLRIP